MLSANRWWLSVALLALPLNGCNVPEPPNVPACEHLGQYLSTDPVTGHEMLNPSPTCMKMINEPECGHCVFVISGQEMFLGEAPEQHYRGKPWSRLRKESVYLPAVESYAPLSTYMINACKKLKCNKEVNRFRLKLDGLNGVKNAVKGP